MNPLSTYFSGVPDPRGDSNAQLHSLLDILTIALCAMLSGAQGFTDMESVGREKRGGVRERLGLKLRNGIPSHDTFGRVFAALDPHAMGQAMQKWTRALRVETQGEVIALDGKAVRRSFDTATGKAALHLVNAWANSNRLVLAQSAVDTKSNESKAIPTLLEMLDVRGCIITCDALNTQKEIARLLVEKEAHYVLALKENHRLLFEEVRDYFAWCKNQPRGQVLVWDSSVQTQEWSHGRHEVRRCFALRVTPLDWPRAVEHWPGLRSLVLVETQRTPTGQGTRAQVHQRFYLSSLPGDAAGLLNAVRDHWGVENGAHWCLDVVFEEDGSRVRQGNAPQNLGLWRRLCLNLLRQETSDKRGVEAKRLRIPITSSLSSSPINPNAIALTFLLPTRCPLCQTG